MRNKKMLAALLALTLGGGFLSSAEEPTGYVYYPATTSGSTNIYTYNPDSQYEICTRVGYTTDLQLRPGETVEGIAAGNTTQWSVDTAQVAGVWHVYVKPLADGLTTNFLINTDQRTYRLIVTSGDTMEYSVRWAYPVEDEQDRLAAQAARTAAEKKAAAEAAAAAANSDRINTNYKVVKNKNVIDIYLPKAVFDNGEKTYIEISEMNKQNFPTVYYYDEYDKSKLQLVNYRVKGSFLEIDKVMDQIKLQYSQKSYLLIERTNTDRDVPSPDEIQLNQTTKEDLSLRSTAARHHLASSVELNENPVSYKEQQQQKRDERRARLMREASVLQNENDVDAMSRLLDVLAPADSPEDAKPDETNSTPEDSGGDEEKGGTQS